VLLLDEPTNGLDPQGMREVRLLLRRLADEGTTVFVSSHLLWEVEAMCDRVGVLARGRLVAQGPPAELRVSGDTIRMEVDDAERARRVLATFAAGTLLDESAEAQDLRRPGTGSLRVRVEPPATAADLNALLVSAGVRVNALIPERATLEEVFLTLVEGADAPR
jgi:ABC-2 type transport system ATP-binding protein